MRALIALTAFAAACFALSGSGSAQPASDPHHPATESGPSATAPASPPANTEAPRAAPGMMGSGMMGPGMMNMMGSGGGTQSDSMMMPMAGMMSGPAADHLEGRLAFIKAELKITDAQMPQWNAYADAVRANGKAMADVQQSMMSARSSANTLPERMAIEEKVATSHATAVKNGKAAVDKLYAVLSPDQKKAADDIIVGPMGMPMGMR